MKLEELFESPIFKNSEWKVKMPAARPFYSEDSIKRNHESIFKGTTDDGKDYWVLMKKDGALASLGFPGRRNDGKYGMDIISVVDFKTPTLSGQKIIPTGKNVLQVALVETAPKEQTKGWGLYLYTSLASAGYVIISDNTQYIAGKALWKRIAANTLHSKYKVYVVDDGVVRLDDTGKPLTYDNQNIDDADLWSEDAKLKYTLFILKAEK